MDSHKCIKNVLSTYIHCICFYSIIDSSNLPNNDLKSCKENGPCILCDFFILYDYNFHYSAFSNLFRVYKVAITLFCTQVCCERAFSTQRLIKNHLRASMSQDQLESLMLLSIESYLIPNSNVVIDNLGKSSTELSKLLIL